MLLSHKDATNQRVPTTRRIGRFEVASVMIASSPEVVRVVLHDCIVVRAEYRYDTDKMHYTALHPEFDEVPFGEVAPSYTATIHTKGSVTRRWERV